MNNYIITLLLLFVFTFLRDKIKEIRKDSCDHLEAHEEWTDEYHIELCSKCRKEFWRIDK
ncbi:MAG: hypothetical protein ACPGSO_00760 [Vicingaceae bacterium]